MATKVQIIFEIANVSPIIFSQKHHPDEKKRKSAASVSLFSSLGNWHPYPGASPHDYLLLATARLLLLSNEGDSDAAFRQYAYPIISQGYDLWQSFSVHTYSKDEWYNGPHPMFYYNVEHDKQLIYES